MKNVSSIPSLLLASFICHGAYFKDEKPILTHLDSSIQDIGIESAIEDILAKVNKLHYRNRKFYQKLWPILAIVIVGKNKINL